MYFYVMYKRTHPPPSTKHQRGREKDDYRKRYQGTQWIARKYIRFLALVRRAKKKRETRAQKKNRCFRWLQRGERNTEVESKSLGRSINCCAWLISAMDRIDFPLLLIITFNSRSKLGNRITNNESKKVLLLSKQRIQVVGHVVVLVRYLSLPQIYDKVRISQAAGVLWLKV